MELTMTANSLGTEEVWENLHQNLLAFAERRVGGRADAEDVVQDVFVRIHTGLARLREADNIHAWVYQIARNAITDHHRANQRAAGIATAVEGEVVRHEAATAREAEVGESAAAGELAACLVPLMESLNAKDAEAIKATELEGLTQLAASEEAGISLSGMKSRVQRARTRLKRVILDCCHVELDRRSHVIGYTSRSRCDDCDC